MKCTVCGRRGVNEVCTKCINEKIERQYKNYSYFCIICDKQQSWGYLYHHLRYDHDIKFKDVPINNENVQNDGTINNSLAFKKPAFELYRIVK